MQVVDGAMDQVCGLLPRALYHDRDVQGTRTPIPADCPSPRWCRQAGISVPVPCTEQMVLTQDPAVLTAQIQQLQAIAQTLLQVGGGVALGLRWGFLVL